MVGQGMPIGLRPWIQPYLKLTLDLTCPMSSQCVPDSESLRLSMSHIHPHLSPARLSPQNVNFCPVTSVTSLPRHQALNLQAITDPLSREAMRLSEGIWKTPGPRRNLWSPLLCLPNSWALPDM